MRLDDNKFGIFGAQRANVTGGEHESACVEGLALPKSVERGNLSLNKVGIRWMSAKSFLRRAQSGSLSMAGVFAVPSCSLLAV